MPIIISGDTTKSVSLTGDQSKSIQASQVYVPPPAYVVAGLEQSHWLASNSVRDGSDKVTSITDYSGVQSLTPWVQYTTAYPCKYESNGWSLNGKTLPTWTFDPTLYGSQQSIYTANDWATKLSNYTGAVTVAMLINAKLYDSPTKTSIFSFSLEDYSNGWQNMTFKNEETGYGSLAWTMDRRTPNYGRQWTGTYYPGQPKSFYEGYKLIFVEYLGTGVGSPSVVSSKIYVNGTLQTIIPNDTSGTFQATTFDRFYIGGSRLSQGGLTTQNVFPGTKFASFHIWKGSLTTQQRTDVTNYLKSISGIA